MPERPKRRAVKRSTISDWGLMVVGFLLVMFHLFAIVANNTGGFCSGGCDLPVDSSFVSLESPFVVGIGLITGNMLYNRRKVELPKP